MKDALLNKRIVGINKCSIMAFNMRKIVIYAKTKTRPGKYAQFAVKMCTYLCRGRLEEVLGILAQFPQIQGFSLQNGRGGGVSSL